MSGEEWFETSLWRDYDRGMVGVGLHGDRRLLEPDVAQDWASRIEEHATKVGVADDEQTQRLIADLRGFAADVE